MADVTIYHNLTCGSSNSHVGHRRRAGGHVRRRPVPKQPPDRATLTWIVEHLEDPVADLVPKDALFERLGLDAVDFYTEPGPVIDLLLEQPKLLQRPIVVKGNLAIIGRPKDRVRQLLEA